MTSPDKDKQDQEDKECYREMEKPGKVNRGRLLNCEKKCSLKEEERRAKKREYSRKQRANATPEQRAKQLEQKRKRRKELRSEDMAQRKELLAKKREQNRRLREERQNKELSTRKPLSEESLRKQQERKRRYILQETSEQRQKRLERTRQHRSKYLAQMTEEERKEYRVRRYFQQKAREANMSKEEREESLKKMSAYSRNYVKNLSPDKKEKQRERSRTYMKQLWKEQPNKLLEYYRQKVATETPEKRQARLRRYKINGAKKKLKKQLEEEGTLSVEDIEKRCEELGEKMKGEPLPPLTEETVSQYKPRPTGRKPKNMTVKPTGRVAQQQKSERERNGKEYKPMPSRRMPKRWGIMYELEMSKEKNPQPEVHAPPSTNISPAAEVEEANGHYGDSYSPQPQQMEEGVPTPEHFCSYCTLAFRSASELKWHKNIEHPWKCPVCSEHIETPNQLVIHFNTVHSSDKFNFLCMRCPWKVGSLSRSCCFRTHKSLLRHVQRHHPSNYWPCPACNLLLYSESRFKSHFAACTFALRLGLGQSAPALCDFCGKKFVNRRLYRIHLNQYHHPDREKFKCPCCGRSCTYSRSFWFHFVKCAKLVPNVDKTGFKTDDNSPNTSQRLEEKSRNNRTAFGPVPCEQCGKTFAQKCTLNDHIRRDHEGNSYICPECGKNFQSAGKRWRHQAEVHGLTDLPPPPGSTVMRCMYCQDFVMRGYEVHVKKKHPEHLEQFQANELPKIRAQMEQVKFTNPKMSYKNRSLWQALPSVDTGQKSRLRLSESEKVSCPLCSVVMAKGSMNRHVKRKHSLLSFKVPNGVNNKLVKCTVCNKAFLNAKLFQQHYSEQHIYDGIEKKLLYKNLIQTKCSYSDCFRKKKEAVCSICNVVLPMDRYSVRVHFLAGHYSKLMEVFESSDVDTTAL